MHVAKMIYPQARFLHIYWLSCQSWWYARWVLMQQFSPLARVAPFKWAPRKAGCRYQDWFHALLMFRRWHSTAKYWSSSYYLGWTFWADLCRCWFVSHTTIHLSDSFTSRVVSKVASESIVDSECNLDRALVWTYYVGSLWRGTGALAMCTSLWNCKAHTSILAMTGLIISCRFACDEIHVNFCTGGWHCVIIFTWSTTLRSLMWYACLGDFHGIHCHGSKVSMRGTWRRIGVEHGHRHVIFVWAEMEHRREAFAVPQDDGGLVPHRHVDGCKLYCGCGADSLQLAGGMSTLEWCWGYGGRIDRSWTCAPGSRMKELPCVWSGILNELENAGVICAHLTGESCVFARMCWGVYRQALMCCSFWFPLVLSLELL